MSFHRALIGACLVCVGCGPAAETPFRTVYDPCHTLVIAAGSSTSSDEAASVGQGIALWNAFGLTRLTTDPTPGAPQVPLDFQAAPAPFHGFYDDGAGDILINNDLTDPQQRMITIAHEVGHAMGLHHVPESERLSLMNPGNLTVLPTPQDEGALSSLWNGCASPP